MSENPHDPGSDRGTGRDRLRELLEAVSESGEPRLPAPNGIYFHPRLSLWVESQPGPRSGADPTALLIQHDLDDTVALFDLVETIPEDQHGLIRHPGHTVLGWDGPAESIAAVPGALVWTEEIWLASNRW